MAREKSRITIYDVADHAGVAISTVSRVLNQSPDVSVSTRMRVERAISQLQYRPDRTARSLAQQEYHTLAVAMPSFTAPFQNELLKGVRACLRENELDVLICDLGSTNHERALMDFLKRGAVRGLLLCGMQVTEAVRRELQGIHSPTVIIGDTCDGIDGWSWNDERGAEAAVSHLIAAGHTDIAMIRSHTDSVLQRDRVAGYRIALEKAGLPVREDHIVAGTIRKHGGFSEEDGHDAMTHILSDLTSVSAVFASSDVQAIGAWAALTECGKTVPSDMALVGYDDIKTSRYIGLSSVDQSMQRIAFEATKRLVARISGAETSAATSEIIIPKLQIRRSSAGRP